MAEDQVGYGEGRKRIAWCRLHLPSSTIPFTVMPGSSRHPLCRSTQEQELLFPS